MMHKNFRLVSYRVIGMFLLASLGVSPAIAVDYLWQAGSGDWNVGGNWNDGLVPEAAFEEVGVINNGGTATLSSSAEDAAGLRLGDLTGESGTLQILSGGSINFVDSSGEPQGVANIGLLGAAGLEVQGGGSFSTTLLDINALGSVIIGSGSGTASVASTGAMYSDGSITTHGAGHVFTAAGNVTLEGNSSYIIDLTSTSHTTLAATGAVNVGGSLIVQSTGFTPAVGDSWNLFDASAINGQFAIDTSAMPVLPFGQTYDFSSVSDGGSSNGVYGRLAIKQNLILNIDRVSGVASITGGASAVNIDGYVIQSALGGLTPGTWNSLEDQSVSNWIESPNSDLGGPGPTANLLGELNPISTLAVTSGSPVSMGAIFQLPTATEFGTVLEDVTFGYYTGGENLEAGIVNYTGAKQHNDIVLLVDPATGEARMENQSIFSVDIDGYRIVSDAGALQVADGSWNSLDDQDAAGGNWLESNSSANQLAELKPGSSTEMSNGLGFNLGELFNVGSEEDLVFQYLFPGETQFQDGIVEYRSFSSSSSADFNEDGFVDATDLGIWESAFSSNPGGDADGDGDSDGTDFLAWQRQFTGSPGISAAAAVPEPSTLVLLIGVVCPLAFMTRRK